ncbi:hypothetical protein ACQKWADRAFT_306470 [Trichoderma austrokoningii]
MPSARFHRLVKAVEAVNVVVVVGNTLVFAAVALSCQTGVIQRPGCLELCDASPGGALSSCPLNHRHQAELRTASMTGPSALSSEPWPCLTRPKLHSQLHRGNQLAPVEPRSGLRGPK